MSCKPNLTFGKLIIKKLGIYDGFYIETRMLSKAFIRSYYLLEDSILIF